ncbi:MAG TPA: hypothetical protein VHX37_13355 [Acidobacteriaceae bacterium]|jgi:hypothetical protein|nr:hypothetical protein [Acidobacteriaceae bacterium]
MARPKKRVLIFSTLEQGSGAMLFALSTRGCSPWQRVTAVSVGTVEEFSFELAALAPDAVLIFRDGSYSNGPVGACERAAVDAGVPILLAARKGDIPQDSLASMALGPKQCDMANILHALGVVTSRKRGPKPVTAAAVAQEALA